MYVFKLERYYQWKTNGIELTVVNIWSCFNLKSSKFLKVRTTPRDGGPPLYKLDRYVSPHRVGSLLCFGLKTGQHFAHFGLESGMVFDGTTRVYERIYRFNSEWVRKKEKYANSKWIWRMFLFAFLSKYWQHNFCLKARSENGYRF